MTLDASSAGHGDLAAIGIAAPTPGAAAARTRTAVLEALDACLAALGAWEAGSAGFGRADESSDLDVCVLCIRGGALHVLEGIDQAMRALGDPIEVWDRGPTALGTQRFWHPGADASSSAGFCTLDVTVIELEQQREQWLELLLPERHGRALQLRDPDGMLADARRQARFDADAHRARIGAEIKDVRGRRMFSELVTKELARGRVLDAHAMYHAMIVTPLVTLLGIRHRPLRYDFGQRYLHEELPRRVVTKLVPLARPDQRELETSVAPACAWIDELLDELDIDALPIEQHAAQMRAAFG